MALDGPRLQPEYGEATHLVVLVHGHGADGRDLISLGGHFQRALPTAAFVAPNAPTRVSGGAGYQWFSISRRDRSEIQSGVTAAAPILDDFLDAELRSLSLGRQRLMLIGFSQGAMLSLAVGLARPCAAILGYSGFLADSNSLPALGAEAPPILLIHGDSDAAVPVDALFYSVAALGMAGARIQWHISPGIGHGIGPDGLALGIDFLSLAACGQLATTGPVHSLLTSS